MCDIRKQQSSICFCVVGSVGVPCRLQRLSSVKLSLDSAGKDSLEFSASSGGRHHLTSGNRLCF